MDPDAFDKLFWSLPTIERQLILWRIDRNPFGEKHRILGYAQGALLYYNLRAARKSHDDAMDAALRTVPGEWQETLRGYIDAPNFAPGEFRRALKRLRELDNGCPLKVESIR